MGLKERQEEKHLMFELLTKKAETFLNLSGLSWEIPQLSSVTQRNKKVMKVLAWLSSKHEISI